MTDDTRLRTLEVRVVTLASDLHAHIQYCEGRWRVFHRVAAGIAALLALGVSVGVALYTRSP